MRLLLRDAAPCNVLAPVTVRVPLILVPAFLIVAVPAVPPKTMILAEPKTFALVTVVFSKLKVVALLVIVPPLAMTLPTNVASPVTERVLLKEPAP